MSTFPPDTGSELGDVVVLARQLTGLFGALYEADDDDVGAGDGGLDTEEDKLAAAREACVRVLRVVLTAAGLPNTEPIDLLDDDRFLAVCLTAAPNLRKTRGKLGTRRGVRGIVPIAPDASPREKTVAMVANLLLDTIRAYGRVN